MGLEHVTHLNIQVAELGVVLLVEGCCPVDAEDEVVVHGHLEAAAAAEVGGVDAAIM